MDADVILHALLDRFHVFPDVFLQIALQFFIQHPALFHGHFSPLGERIQHLAALFLCNGRSAIPAKINFRSPLVI